MDFNCAKDSCMKRFCAYCCGYRRDLLRNNNFVSTIEISPRVITCTKMAVCETYYQPITIKNNGTLSRRLSFFTDPNCDVAFKVTSNSELTSGASMVVDVYIEPTKKKFINRNRFFYILAEHPDIVWEIPILVIRENPEIFVPELICLHKVPPGTNTNYQCVLYNPTENEFPVSMCSNFEGLKITPENGTLPATNYCKVLLSCKIAAQPMTICMSIFIKGGRTYRLSIRTETSDQVIYLSTNLMTFDDTFMGSKVQKNLHICNKSMDTVSYQWSCSDTLEDLKSGEKFEDVLIISNFLKIRNRRGCISPLGSALSIVTFNPPLDYGYSEDEEPPFPVNNTIYLFCPIFGPNSYRFQITGSILGPHIEVSPTDVELKNIFLGQMMCDDFTFTNKGLISGEVRFKGSTDQSEMRCNLVPKSMVLAPGTNGVFHISYYRRNVGKFLTKLLFKIKSGVSIAILLRGTTLPAKVKFWPDSFELGDIPICIPQKRLALVTNPLPVPIVVQPTVAEDGENDPLILCVDKSKIPLRSRPAIYYELQCHKSRYAAHEDEEMNPSYSDFGTKHSALSVSNSQLSYYFKDKVVDDIPEMAEKLLQNIKTLGLIHQSEAGMHIIDAALDCLLDQSEYFECLRVKQNYMNMDWRSLPCDAKEVAIEAEQFYLNPGESKSFPVVLIPNSSGPSAKDIEFQACPLGVESSDIRTAIRSKYLVNTLRLKYRCTVPCIRYNENMAFLNTLYVDLIYPFTMSFTNVDVVSGFFYFKVLASCKEGKMFIDESNQKYHVMPSEEIEVPCSIIYLRVGKIVLHGLFQMVGKVMEYPFRVTADVIPPKVKISSEKIINKQEVLKTTLVRLFIENVCPTRAQFSIALKCREYQYLEPRGGCLAPGQCILISIWSKFYDPGIYKNIIGLKIKHADIICIPVSYTIEGIPLIFEPDIRKGFDLGCMFKKGGYQNNLVIATNYGQRPYKILFMRTKLKRTQQLPPSFFDIMPYSLEFAAGEKVEINFRLKTWKAAYVEEFYTVNGVDANLVSFKFFKFSIKSVIINSKTAWSKSDICLTKEVGNECSSSIKDTVILANLTDLKSNISLFVTGCFLLGDCDSKEVHFDLEGNGRIRLTIKLNECELDGEEACEYHEGSIKCVANNHAQASLQLRTRIKMPAISICPDDITLFTQNFISYAHILLSNCSELKASFSWNQKLLEVIETAVIDNYESICAKTISEKVLAPSFNDTPLKPDYLTPKRPELHPSETKQSCDEQSTEMSTVTSNERTSSQDTSSKIKSSTSNKRSSNTALINTGFFNTTSTFKKYLSSKKLSSFPEPPKHQPVFIKTKTNTKGIGIIKVMEYIRKIRDAEPILSSKSQQDKGTCIGTQESDFESEPQDTSVVKFQQPAGCVSPGETAKAYIFLPPITEGHTLVAQFELDVMNGRTENLKLGITGVKARVQLSKTDIDLGKSAWYNTISDKLVMTNQCPFAIRVALLENPDCGTGDKKLYNGHVGIAPPPQFIMKANEQIQIKWKAIYGFRHDFAEDIGIEINNNITPIQIHYHGCGQMPMALVMNLKLASRKSIDTVTSYLTMRSVYGSVNPKYNTQKSRESLNATDTQIHLTDSYSDSEDDEAESENKENKKSSDFVALDYSDTTGPKAIEIERLIETWKLITELNKSQTLRTRLHRFYCHCLRLKAMEFESTLNLKYTICRPIPWEQPFHVIDMEKVQLNSTKAREVDLIYTGPGRAFISVRTLIPIPGFMACFQTPPKAEKKTVIFVQTPDEKRFKRYKNMRMRNSSSSYVDSNEEYKLAHAHSYDLDDDIEHTRDHITLEQASEIKKYYAKIGQPPKEKKSNLILSEICQTTNASWSNKPIKLLIMLTIEGRYYEVGQLIEEHLMIDVHMGPTLPFVLRARVTRSEEQITAPDSVR